MDAKDRITKAIIQVIPKSILNFIEVKDGGYGTNLKWMLEENQSMSGGVELFITKEIFDVFKNYSESQMQISIDSFKAYLCDQLKAFNPKHEGTEIWNVPSAVLIVD